MLIQPPVAIDGYLGKAKNYLVTNYGVNKRDISVALKQQVVWRSSCLGVPKKGSCAMVLTQGYRLWLKSGSWYYFFNTDTKHAAIYRYRTTKKPTYQGGIGFGISSVR